MTLAELLAVTVLCFHGVLTQNWFPGGRSMGGRTAMGGRAAMMGSQVNRPPRYLTCIGQTANNDQLRVTFSSNAGSSSGTSRTMSGVRVQANVRAGVSSMIDDNFQLIITSNGRIDGMCDANALGPILPLMSSSARRPGIFGAMQTNNQQQNQNGPLATIGSVFHLRPGQAVSMTDIISGITYSRLAGSGMAICNHVVGNRCAGNSVPLCCTISRDSSTAVQRLPNGMMNGMGGMNGMNGMNGMGGMGGMNGISNGMGGGMGGGINSINSMGNNGIINNNIPGNAGGQALVFP